MRHLKDKTVYLIPTGNHARYNTKPLKATLLKVARVNVTFVKDGYNREEKYRFDGNVLTSKEDCNAGYLLFESVEALEDHPKTVRLAQVLSKKFSYSRALERVGLEKLRLIAEVLGIEEN